MISAQDLDPKQLPLAFTFKRNSETDTEIDLKDGFSWDVLLRRVLDVEHRVYAAGAFSGSVDLSSLLMGMTSIEISSVSATGNLTLPTPTSGRAYDFTLVIPTKASSGGPFVVTAKTSAAGQPTVQIPISPAADTMKDTLLELHLHVTSAGAVTSPGFVISGQNTNGSYIKFGDGTMICRSVATPVQVAAASGGYIVTWTFPALFANTGVTAHYTLAPSNTVSGVILGPLAGIGASQAAWYVINGSTPQTFNFYCTAIGPWK